LACLAKFYFVLFYNFKYNKFLLKIVKWTFNQLNAFCAYMGIYFGGFAAIMTQQLLYISQVCATFKRMGLFVSVVSSGFKNLRREGNFKK